jgi:hypothetical protein
MFITAILWCYGELNFYFAINEEYLALINYVTGGLLLITLGLSKECTAYFRHWNSKVAGGTIHF